MKKELIKDNYYEAVNGQWLEKTEIPSDQPQISAFLELHLGIEKTLMDLAKSWSLDSKGLNSNLLKFVKVYNKANDFSKREKLGTSAINKLIDEINNIDSLKYLEKKYYDLNLSGIYLPINFDVAQDFINSNDQVLYFQEPGIILPDTSYYQNPQQKEQLMNLWINSTTTVLKLYGLNEEETSKLINDAIKFDALVVPVTKSSIEKADYVSLYSPLEVEAVKEKVKNIDLVKIAKSLVGDSLDKIVFMNNNFAPNSDAILNDANLEILLSWMKVNTYLSYASEFTEELRIASGAFRRALLGTQEASKKEKDAFYKSYNYFSQEVGLYYGINYFGEKARSDVRNMVNEMVLVYKDRIASNTWLKEETKKKALVKLNALTVHVGYPDELPKYYDLINIADEDSLLEIRININKLIKIDDLSKYKQAPNKNLWFMPASMVNAYYSPQNNQIVFPAAILQEPYYSINQSVSENFGGIGAVIAHEITHAFDNNGAKFDEFGSLSNWWTDEDLEAFNEKRKEMITLFDGVETGYGKCNGLLTVSENIADSGGLRAALEASKKHSDHDLEKFFANWARVWRAKASLEYQQLLLNVDVHGPSLLRANMQLSNLKEFQKFYKLNKDDKMYLEESKMVSIW